MAGAVDIATTRQSSGSPRNQQSSLTSQLQQPRIDVREEPNMQSHEHESQSRDRQESVGMLGTTPYGARSIPVREGMIRRDSYGNPLSGSLMNGMSWGGISVGSFIRDE